MGMAAYAVDENGSRLIAEPVPDSVHPRLSNPEQRKAFAQAQRALRDLGVKHIDADFDVGALCISRYASAVNWLAWVHLDLIQWCDEYKPDSVLRVAQRLQTGDLSPNLPASVLRDYEAMEHARAFIYTCAELGLGIEISP